MKLEWRNAEKKLYLPKANPERIRVPALKFFVLSGQGDPNEPFFAEYIQALYALSYGVKMSYKSDFVPEGYQEYTVYPLEGVWDISEAAKTMQKDKWDKSQLVFDLMIRQPDFVNEGFAGEIIERTFKKKPLPLLREVRFISIEEGDCVQMLHVGPFDNEPESFALMEQFCEEQQLKRVSKKHREIYLSDPRKVAPEKLKTTLRFQVTPV